jgi:hypothetical protein
MIRNFYSLVQDFLKCEIECEQKIKDFFSSIKQVDLNFFYLVAFKPLCSDFVVKLFAIVYEF